jgi:hypothetical protein
MTEYTVKQNNVDAWHLVPAEHGAAIGVAVWFVRLCAERFPGALAL